MLASLAPNVKKGVIMTTIMTWGNSEGTKGRCDSRCHQAIHPKCVCICNGRFHSSAHRPGGIEQAVRDTWEEAIEEAEQKAKSEGTELDTSRLRKFIGLEKYNRLAADQLDEIDRLAHYEKQRSQIAVQGRLPLEVG